MNIPAMVTELAPEDHPSAGAHRGGQGGPAF